MAGSNTHSPSLGTVIVFPSGLTVDPAGGISEIVTSVIAGVVPSPNISLVSGLNVVEVPGFGFLATSSVAAIGVAS